MNPRLLFRLCQSSLSGPRTKCFGNPPPHRLDEHAPGLLVYKRVDLEGRKRSLRRLGYGGVDPPPQFLLRLLWPPSEPNLDEAVRVDPERCRKNHMPVPLDAYRNGFGAVLQTASLLLF